jgi:amidohydrolase
MGPPTSALPLALDPALHEAMIAARRHLHAYPELSNDERETQAFIAQWLREQGVGEAKAVAGTGAVIDVVGTAGASNRKIAIRADIDALPIVEQSGVAFASKRRGVMHACGHDAHTAMGLATAALLYRARDRFCGTVRMIFQPAEEAEPLGGRRIVEEDRILEDIDASIGIHVDPYLETGKLGASAGAFTLSSDIFDIVIKGRSAHAAKPNEGIDAIAVGAAIVSEVQKIVSRETDAFDALIVSITGFSGGGAYNIIADHVELKGTIRSGKPETRRRAHQRLKAIVSGLAESHGAEATVEIVTGEPSVQNDAEMVQLIQDVAPDKFLALPGWTAADDFGFYSQAKPSVYFRLGIRNEAAGSVHPLHHPEFRVDEQALGIGVTTLAAAALRFLERV